MATAGLAAGPNRHTRFLAQVHLPELQKAVRDPAADPEPWAAFALGYHSRMVPCWQGLHWRMPNEEYDTENSVPLSVAQLQIVRNVLTRVMPATVYQGIGTVLEDLDQHSDRLARAWHCDRQYEGRAFGQGNAPGQALAESLCALVSRALPAEDRLGRWLALGVAVGTYDASLYLDTQFDRFGAFATIPKAAKLVPAPDRNRVPVVTVLGQLADGLTGQELVQVFMAKAVDLGLAQAGDPIERPYLLTNCMSGLRDHVLDRLLGFRVAPAVRQDLKPVWKEDGGELWFDGELIKTIKRAAINQYDLLDKFQNEGWPDRIDAPARFFNVGDGCIRDTVKALNQNLQRIRFLADGAGEGIRWEVRRE